MQSACSRHAGGAVANAGAGGAAACGRHAVGMQAGHAGGMQVGRAVANTGAGGAAACSLHAVGMQAVLWPTPAQEEQLRVVGMQSACRRHAGGACRRHAGGACCGQHRRRGYSCMQAGHAVGMQAACRRGMQVGMAACSWGALRRRTGAAACRRQAGRRHAGQSVLDLPKLLYRVQPNLVEFLCEF